MLSRRLSNWFAAPSRDMVLKANFSLAGRPAVRVAQDSPTGSSSLRHRGKFSSGAQTLMFSQRPRSDLPPC